ncbi:MAG: hypothetical protein PHS32_10495 [Rhodoferax sp.]|uniref:hypothetical protein n=1 Tax=Rhodoferax sp. TaxID=50421 RepID=UPI002629CB31|nr:hypothetical protein [Rhodoferax sp.]MDD5334164.1 hypothetical protein [Rhodoferax sp.]
MRLFSDYAAGHQNNIDSINWSGSVTVVLEEGAGFGHLAERAQMWQATAVA